MALFSRLKKYYKSPMRKNEVVNKEWYIFPWQYILVFALMFIVVLLNVIPNWVVKKDEFGNVDQLFSYPLRDHVVYSTFTLIFTIGTAIFVGVFIEIGGYAGPFSSAIFVLVPSLVWLLSDRSGNNYVDILDMSMGLSNVMFYVGAGVIGFFLVARIFKSLLLTEFRSFSMKKKTEFTYSYINRSMFIITNVIIVVTMGYALVNYGVFTLRLAESLDDSGKTVIDFGSTSMIIYIAVIAVIFALLMVFIGLSNLFVDNTIHEWRKDASTEINAGNVSLTRLQNQRLERLKRKEQERLARRKGEVE